LKYLAFLFLVQSSDQLLVNVNTRKRGKKTGLEKDNAGGKALWKQIESSNRKTW